MDAPFPARLPLEMFDGIRDVNLIAVDPRFLECAFEQPARRPNKWFSSKILLIAGLFAQKHQPRVFRSFAEHGLGSAFVKRACRTTPGRFRQGPQARSFRHCRGGPIVRIVIWNSRFAPFHWSRAGHSNTSSAFPPAA